MAVRFLSSENIDGNVKIADEKILALRTSSNDYAIQYRDLDFRFIGSADSSTQRKFSFGYYTSDNPAGTWNGQVYINSYTGSVGIGTNSPSHALDVTSGAYDQVQWTRTSGVSGYLYSDSAGAGIYSGASISQAGIYLKPNISMDFRVNGTERMFINSSGNVGIGTTSPSQKLHVVGTIYSVNSGTDGGQIRLANSGGGSNWYWAARTTGLNLGELGAADGRIFIANGGNVGIGTTSPSTKLHISGGDPSIRLTPSGSNDARVDFTDSGGTVRWYTGYDVSSGNLVIAADEGGFGSSNIMVMSDSGNLTVGGTAFDAAGSASLKSNGIIRGVLSSGTADSTIINAIYGVSNGFQLSNDASNNQEYIFHNGGSVSLKINSSGNVGIGTTSPGYKLDINGTTAAGFRLTTNGFTNLDLVSNRTSGNLGGLRFKQDIDTQQTSEFLGLHGGGFDWKSGDGSAAPTIKMSLTAAGNLGITAAASFRFNGAGDNTHAVGYDSTVDGSFLRGQNGMRFITGTGGGSERMRITSDGMVGIGMTPSTVGSSTYMLQMYNSGSQCFLSIGNGTSGNGPTNGLIIGNDAGNAYVLNREATPLKFYTNDTERLRIDSAGDSFFKGNITIDGFAGGKYLSLRDATCCNNPSGSGGVGLKAIDHSGAANDGLGIYGHDGVSIYTIQTKRMQVDSAGFSRFTTSGSFSYGPGYNFHEFVNNYGGEPTLMVANTATGNPNNYGINVIHDSTAANTTGRFFLGQTASTERIKIFSNGNIQNSNNSYGQLSDETIKENIVDATPKLNEINQVRVVNFNYIGDTQKQIGVVAQELEQIFPGLVYEVGNTEIDENGKEVPTGETTKAVKYSVFVPMLIKSIQELKAEIDTLKSQIQ